MCVVCGCGDAPAGREHEHDHAHGHAHVHPHEHPHKHPHAHPHPERGTMRPLGDDLHYGLGPARVSVPGMSQTRAIRIEQDVLGENNRYAARNRASFAAHGVRAFNLVSSPGSGKTTLLCATIEALARRDPSTDPDTGADVAVIEGDQQTSHDADRIRATGAPAIQINTGKGCHLDARMVGEAFARLPMQGHDDRPDARARRLLFIENVGNLVCPAMWDLGEVAKVVILSVTEGEDKPLKYPDMFAAASLMILNKIDLLPYVRFDVAQCIAYARQVNPGIQVLQLSATNGAGMDAWLEWLTDDLSVDIGAGIDVSVQAEADTGAAPAHV